MTKLQRALLINSPSILLLIWAVVQLIGLHGVVVRVTFMLALSAAFFFEERVKWVERQHAREEPPESYETGA